MGPGQARMMRWLFTFVALQCSPSQAQVYKFKLVEAPKPKELQTLYAFFVYSLEDTPAGKGEPFMRFSELSGMSTEDHTPTDLLHSYRGLQLSTLLYRDFWNAINSSQYCSTQQDKDFGNAAHAGQLLTRRGYDVFSYTVPFAAETAKPDLRVPISKTGIYILTFSNCGELSNAVVSGSVTVKNPYGFLPGNEYHKMPFYAYLGAAYGILAIIWAVLCTRWCEELFHIQYCIGGVTVLGLMEAFWWWAFLNHFNHNGILLKWLLVVAILFSVLKSVLSYMLVLVASLGWGVTRPELERWTSVKIQVIAFLYIVLSFIREIAFTFRTSHTLSFAFVLMCLLPVALLNGGIFYWVFTALGSLIEQLQEEKQHEKLQLFRRLWLVLTAAMAIAGFTVMFQMVDTSRGISTRWHYQWFLSDGISHIVFYVVLVAMMALWKPHENSQRFAYSEQINQSEDVEEAGKPAPMEIGAPDPLDETVA